MSVETALGISSEMANRIVEERWAGWSDGLSAAPQLRVEEVPGWLRTARFEESNEALRLLAREGSETGGNDIEAATLLAWVLLPAACRVAFEVSALARDDTVDQVVASQLWLEIRTFRWRTSAMVVGTLRRNLRKHVLAELGFTEPDPRAPRTVLLEDSEWESIEAPGRPESAAEELAALLEVGVRTGTIGEAHRELLLEMIEAAHEHPARLRPLNALLSVANLVAMRRGVTGRQVRRVSRRALNALARDADILWEHVGRIA